jgi:elongation of very long chain fatty acids protein 6
MEALNNFIEQHTDWRNWAPWMREHYSVAYSICVAYVVIIFGIQWIMKDERIKPFELRKPLIIWNIILATFSIIGALNVVPAHINTLMTEGLSGDLCGPTSELSNPWVCLFCLSKIPELLDTLFLVLRKRPVIFLHWYHHVATLLYCWDAWAIQILNGGWFALMNLVVHSIMYTYFAFTAYGIRFSNRTRLTITTLQISQMFVGIMVLLHNLVVCPLHPRNYIMGLIMYASYAVLFIQVFMKSLKGEHRPRPNNKVIGEHKEIISIENKEKAE